MAMLRAKLPNGIELDYVDEGPRDAPVVLMMHFANVLDQRFLLQLSFFLSNF